MCEECVEDLSRVTTGPLPRAWQPQSPYLRQYPARLSCFVTRISPTMWSCFPIYSLSRWPDDHKTETFFSYLIFQTAGPHTPGLICKMPVWPWPNMSFRTNEVYDPLVWRFNGFGASWERSFETKAPLICLLDHRVHKGIQDLFFFNWLRPSLLKNYNLHLKYDMHSKLWE